MELLLIACLGLGLDVLTVDDDGPADFPDIASAVAASQAGDVVLVSGGVYGEFEPLHALAILGVDRVDPPRVTGQVRVVGVAHVTLDGLRMTSLAAEGASALVVRGGSLGDWADPGVLGALGVEGDSSAVLSHVKVRGSKANDWNPAPPCIVVIGSELVLSGCDVVGAEGYTSSRLYEIGGAGGIGLQIAGDSHVWLASTSVRGGEGGWGTTPFSPDDGNGGTGIHISDSMLVATGPPADVIWTGGWDPTFGTAGPGHSLILEDATVRASGVTIGQDLGPLLTGDSSLILPPVPDPWVEASDSVPGELRFYGPAGLKLVAGLGVIDQPVIGMQGASALWFEPAAPGTLLFAVTTAGSGTPVTIQVPSASLGPLGTARALQALRRGDAAELPFVAAPDIVVAKP